MRSDIPVHLQGFRELGRKGKALDSEDADKLKACSSRKSKARSSQKSGWLLRHLDMGSSQSEHFQDWLLINSTCRSFRAWGMKAFFSEKIFFGTDSFWLITWANGLSAESVAVAREGIRHVIVQHRRDYFLAIIATITKKILPCLRRMSLLLCCPNFATPLALHSFQCLRRPLPKSFSKFLRNIGVPVDRLQMDIVFGKDRRYNEREPDDKVHCLMTLMDKHRANMSRARNDPRE